MTDEKHLCNSKAMPSPEGEDRCRGLRDGVIMCCSKHKPGVTHITAASTKTRESEMRLLLMQQA